VVNYCSKYVVKERAWWSVHLSRARYAALMSEPALFRLDGGCLSSSESPLWKQL
jgi:hypothetical protein